MESVITDRDENRFTKRIGTTRYVVHVHFSETDDSTLQDRLFHLIRNDMSGNGLRNEAE